MQTKTLLKKIILIIPTTVFLLNLAFADGDYAGSSSDQTEYYEDTNDSNLAPNDENSATYIDSGQDQEQMQEDDQGDTNNDNPDDSSYYNES